MCDGQSADGCEIITLADFETTLNNRLATLDDQFAIINDILKAKKEAFITMYRKNPKTSHDEAVRRLQNTLESFDPRNTGEILELEAATEGKQTIICQSFSDDNTYGSTLTVSPCKRSLISREGYGDIGCCFINHPKIQKNQILKWSLRVPKFKIQTIGMVTILELIIFDFLKITFQRHWYICQSTNGVLVQSKPI